MIGACGHGPSYSGRFIARAVELYLNGVKPGYIRWHELQYTLEVEFPSEFRVKRQDRPSPETVMDWVRKYPDAPQRLKQLRVQDIAPAQGMPSYPFGHQSPLLPPIPVASAASADMTTLSHLMALMAMALMVRFVRSVART